MKNVVGKIKNKIFNYFFIQKKIYFLLISIIIILINCNVFGNFILTSNSTNTSPQLKINQKYNLRFLNQTNIITNINNSSNNETNNVNAFNNNTFDLILKVKPLKANITRKIIYYEFIKSITSGYYSGNWDNLYIQKNRFLEKNGEAYLYFNQKKDVNYLLNLDEDVNNSKILLTFFIKDGKYFDDCIRVNFTFGFDDMSLIDLNNGILNFVIKNATISYRWLHFYLFEKINYLNNSFINLTFYKKFITFENYVKYQTTSNDYGNITLEIKKNSFITNYTNASNNSNNSYGKYFEISFKGVATGSDNYSIITLNYCIYITAFCFLEIYFILPFFISVRRNYQLALNTDIFTLFIQYLWILLLNMENLFLMFLEKNYYQEYLAPFLFYFIYTFIIQDYLMLSWKSRYRNLNNNRRALIKKYLIFVTICHSLLYSILLQIKCWYSNFFYTFILYTSLWSGQIIYSIRKGTKPPMPYSYILFSSFSKLSICFYVKVYKNNIYNYRTNYLTMFCVTLIVIIEVIIICLQKYLGPKFIIPKKYRKKGYNYYLNENDLSQEQKENDCVICLNKIENIDINLEENNNINRNFFIEKIKKYLEKLKDKEKKKGNYMKTPCNHIYHAKCLELWLNVKNQCPYCTQNIPPLDNE